MRITIVFTIILSVFIFLGSCEKVYAQDTDIGQSQIHPAHPLYFLKTIRENLEMHFAKTPRVKMIRQLEFATRRLREIKALVGKNEVLIQPTLERYWSHISFLPQKDLEDKELASLISGTIAKHINILEKLNDQVIEKKTKMSIRATLNRLSTRLDLFEETRSSVCKFLSKEASSSALNEVEKVILIERVEICKLSRNF